ncbi:hypothetical protein A2334_04565 [Candidatus Roizmanbacteria bacterium RIFOXYB2_FULL_38_10]|uniref:YibE/F family protein n=1 Tax=Candidatus Roizmanbacteria bacterium RIFOXYD1_FULL_38_12 TaxID=1802093 RepID=A0A1F7KZS1_9BACT|nr:MAG: hypothetical protein A3K47_00670 [Candidatus Roizmanbacteria bacterium RIFOXYA2_FULL_38_14]OGK63303.1 MAG: hypothetical protein A3K27_00670 [Candidatus Roizmanbacteria bacterium RIFOXYA1_FULL_37_12]OGK65149.1 MAG: hypothetical protein A3K38_00670 [Candidatus Roizmanbacteria bacterium RIFOXYB1_FULL_40_23]OGK68704.1 MAG: hypothetical protein A2334_04565 [Candidatus Roizmanbacteria bacterium RIFOXYB2_FULL_38_10]OGK69553.1 MAG: hypothetical protein A3K21_00670 [Candidatus Roizmanbacteria ba
MKKIFLILLFFIVFFCSSTVFAQTEVVNTPPKQEILEAVVSKVIEEKQIEVMQKKQLFQKLELEITKGTLMGQKIIIKNGNIPLASQQKYQLDDKVMISISEGLDGKKSYYISDYIRRDSLLVLFLIFVVLTVAVAKTRGLTSLIGMGISFLVIFFIILPQISSGADPVSAAILGSLIIIPVSFFLSHGLNKKTFVAIGGTLIALLITGILSNIFVEAAHLTGFASEEAGFLQIAKQGAIDMKGLLLAGIIIGVLGVLDDITISQSAIVFQLKEANNRLNADDLYKRAMSVGQDHISSMVNTLILVYTGAGLPLLLLFINNPRPFLEIINYEIIADEIIRTLVGSIGLVLSVPITTFIATFVASNKKWLRV